MKLNKTCFLLSYFIFINADRQVLVQTNMVVSTENRTRQRRKSVSDPRRTPRSDCPALIIWHRMTVSLSNHMTSLSNFKPRTNSFVKKRTELLQSAVNFGDA